MKKVNSSVQQAVSSRVLALFVTLRGWRIFAVSIRPSHFKGTATECCIQPIRIHHFTWLLNTMHFWYIFDIMRFQAFSAVRVTITNFWVSARCGLVSGYQRFGGTHCLHLQGWSGDVGRGRIYIGLETGGWENGSPFAISTQKMDTVCFFKTPKPGRTSSHSKSFWIHQTKCRPTDTDKVRAVSCRLHFLCANLLCEVMSIHNSKDFKHKWLRAMLICGKVHPSAALFRLGRRDFYAIYAKAGQLKLR
jgi:hypothetical protein